MSVKIRVCGLSVTDYWKFIPTISFRAGPSGKEHQNARQMDGARDLTQYNLWEDYLVIYCFANGGWGRVGIKIGLSLMGLRGDCAA